MYGLCSICPTQSHTHTCARFILSDAAQVELPPDVNVSAECRDLLVKMLKKDPNCRISWNEVFRHPFLCVRLSCLALP